MYRSLCTCIRIEISFNINFIYLIVFCLIIIIIYINNILYGSCLCTMIESSIVDIISDK